jgi:hypothetical protein
MPLQNFPHVRPTPMVLPTKDFPWLKRLMNEVDFACATCSSAQGQPVYHTLAEAHREPLSAEPTSHGGSITPKGMIATRFLVLCPTCRTVPENNPMMPGGFCDLMAVPKDYKRPFRPQGTGGDGLTYDGDDDGDDVALRVPKTRKFGSSKLKKTSDLKPVKLTPAQKKMIKKAQESNFEPVPANAVTAAKGKK